MPFDFAAHTAPLYQVAPHTWLAAQVRGARKILHGPEMQRRRMNVYVIAAHVKHGLLKPVTDLSAFSSLEFTAQDAAAMIEHPRAEFKNLEAFTAGDERQPVRVALERRRMSEAAKPQSEPEVDDKTEPDDTEPSKESNPNPAGAAARVPRKAKPNA